MENVVTDSEVRESALTVLKNMTTDEKLRDLAQAVADAKMPIDSVTPILMGKLLYNREAYSGWDNLVELVRGTKRQGMFIRPISKRAKARAENGQRNRTPNGVRHVVERLHPNEQPFWVALEVCRSSFRDCTYPPFTTTSKRNVAEWKTALKKAGNNRRCGMSAMDTAARALVDKAASTTGTLGALALIPVDRYLAMTMMGLPYDDNIRALNFVAGLIKDNLAAKPTLGGGRMVLSSLPVTPTVRKNLFGGNRVNYSREYFKRHQMPIWNDMLTCWAFSPVGREVDMQQQSKLLLDRLSGMLPDDIKATFGKWVQNGGLHCVVCDAETPQFGYRTALFAVYEEEDARKLAEKAIHVRTTLMRSNFKAAEMVRKLLTQDLAIQIISTSRGVYASQMIHFADLFGKLTAW